MPVEPTLNNLQRLVAESLQSGEFEEPAERVGLNQVKIVSSLSGEVTKIWETAAKPMIDLQLLQTQYDDKLSTRVAAAVRRQQRAFRNAKLIIFTNVPFFIVLYFALRFSNVTAPGLYPILHASLWFVLIGIVVVVVVSAVVYNYKRSRVRDAEFSGYGIAREEAFASLKEQIASQEKVVEDVIIAQGIKPRIREMLETRLDLPFSDHLPKLDFSGLSEVFNSANEVATDAKRQLQFMLSTMPGGSIGVAGPRGSGKSTLLHSACKDRPDNLTKYKVVPLLTTSPVEYEARDFILHLFSSMCDKVLDLTTRKGSSRGAFEDLAEQNRSRALSIFGVLRSLMIPAFLLGTSLITFSVFLATLTMNPAAPSSVTNAQPSPTQAAAGQNVPSPAPPSPTPVPTPGKLVRFIQALDLKPGTLFIWGLFLTLFFFVMRFEVQYHYRREGRLQLQIRQHHQDSWDDRIRTLGLDPETTTRLEETRDSAHQWLKDIKFQQSYTSGWSGALKLPIGLEGGMSDAVTLAQKQLSLPDISKGFCSFVSAMGRDFKIIIGIDELDKLESDESAQRFLNEIKAVFGIANVFYLISVSENAMSNFERRGVPFRDVFDSSFDNIVYVDYLTIEYAKRLIARRVIAMPPPFVHLCYCISGGLARDLVRTCRNLMQYSHTAHAAAEGGPDSNLRVLSAALIKSDLRLKLHALTVVAKKLSQGAALDAFLHKLQSLENELDSAPLLLKAYEEFLKGGRAPVTEKDLTDGASGLVEVYGKLKQRLSGEAPSVSDAKTLCALHEELATYLYYCVTVLQFFSDVLSPQTMIKAEADKVFDELSRARQYLAINASITRTMLDKFRGSFGMDVPGVGS